MRKSLIGKPERNPEFPAGNEYATVHISADCSEYIFEPQTRWR